MLPEKSSWLQQSIARSAFDREFLVLRAVLQRQVRLEQPVDQLSFLLLGAEARQEQKDEQGGGKPSHIAQADEAMAFL